MLIIQILGAHAHTGMKMYQALSGSASQRSVQRAVAQDRLSPDQFIELENLLRDVKKTSKKRNDIVHGHWAISDSHLDDLVWCDSADDIIKQSEFHATFASHSETNFLKYLYVERPDFPKAIHVLIGKKELEDILQEVSEVALAFWNLRAKLREMGFDKSR